MINFVGAAIIGGILYILSSDEEDDPKNKGDPKFEKSRKELGEAHAALSKDQTLILTQEEIRKLRKDLKSAIKRKKDLLPENSPDPEDQD